MRFFTSIRSISKHLIKLCWFIGSLLLVTTQAQAETYYFHNDQLGTPQVVSDSAQQVVWKGEYDPFGGCTKSIESIEQNIRFPGQYFDQETGLHYNYFRTYDPDIGRYVESDPIGLVGGLSTYGYAYQNSLNYTDPTGEFVPFVYYGLTAAWAAFEIIGSAYDIYGAASTFADECSSTTEKVLAGGGLLAGVVLPGAGYSAAKNVPKGGLGDLTSAEVKQLQRVADEAGRPLEVVGSAASGTRRGVGTNLPIGKGPGTRSDIDVLVGPASRKHFDSLESQIPSLDPKSGIITGTHNPYIGPGVRFEPGATPKFISRAGGN